MYNLTPHLTLKLMQQVSSVSARDTAAAVYNSAHFSLPSNRSSSGDLRVWVHHPLQHGHLVDRVHQLFEPRLAITKSLFFCLWISDRVLMER